MSAKVGELADWQTANPNQVCPLLLVSLHRRLGPDKKIAAKVR